MSWSPMIDQPLRARALTVAHQVAGRLSNQELVAAAAELATRQSAYPRPYTALTLFGFDGVALPLAQYARCFPADGHVAASLEQAVRLAARDTQRSPLLFPALFGGTTGMCWLLTELARDDRRYGTAAGALLTKLCQQAVDWPWRREPGEAGVAFSDYDVISGASGVLRFLVAVESPPAGILPAIDALLSYLVWLSDQDQQGRPRWYLPPELYPQGFEDLYLRSYPRGYFNLGLAHGIPGPLAALACAWSAGYRTDGQERAIAFLCDWIIAHACSDEYGINWPTGVPWGGGSWLEQEGREVARAAWCYGAPGIARALWLAGVALDNVTWREVATRAIEAVVRRPEGVRGIPAPTLCHGLAGLLVICLRFAQETGSPAVEEHIPVLLERILGQFRPESPLGFREWEEQVEVDTPTWLSGAPGTLLALLAAATDIPPSWDRCLLIS